MSGPAADRVAAVEEHFEKADKPRVVDFDPRIENRAAGHGQDQPLELGKGQADAAAPRSKAGETASHRLECFPHRTEVIEPIFQSGVYFGLYERISCKTQ